MVNFLPIPSVFSKIIFTFQSLNPFQEGQPRTFLVTARGALRRVWFAEFLANKTSYLHLERSSSQRGGWFVSFHIYVFIWLHQALVAAWGISRIKCGISAAAVVIVHRL